MSPCEQPISRFVGEQGQIWVDHDWMELFRFDSAVKNSELLKRGNLSGFNKIKSAARKLGVSEANVMIVIINDEIKSPRSVQHDTYTLTYIGNFASDEADSLLKTITRAAEAGDVDAQEELGTAYISTSSEIVKKKDLAKAAHWLLKAAAGGNVSTYQKRYHIYANVDSPLHDLSEAFVWLEKAAQFGGGYALMYLGHSYETGAVVEKSNVLALRSYFLSSCQKQVGVGDEQVQRLAANMTTQDVLEAERMALAWIKSNRKVAKDFKGLNSNPLEKAD